MIHTNIIRPLTDLEKWRNLLFMVGIDYEQIYDEEVIFSDDYKTTTVNPLIILNINKAHLVPKLYNAGLRIRFSSDGKFKDFDATGE